MPLSTLAWLRTPLRRAGRALYWRLPAKCRDPLVRWIYRNFAPVFRGLPDYEYRKRAQYNESVLTEEKTHEDAHEGLVRLDAFPAASEAGGRLAVHIHIFYCDLAQEFAGYLKNIPFAFDLYISVSDEVCARECRSWFEALPKIEALRISVVPNRGRDIAPFLCEFGSQIARYDFVAHFHSKKSLYNDGATTGWREYLLDSLLGSEDTVRRIFSVLQDGVPMVFPQNYSAVPYVAASWLANRPAGAHWCRRLGVAEMPRGYFDFPTGSMFWARAKTLEPLLCSGIQLEDFEPEHGQTDGTLAHAVERLFGLVAAASGRAPAILRDATHPSWSRWRFEQYWERTRDWYQAAFVSPKIEVIVFDVFDTLIDRPLIDPEDVKEIVATRLQEPLSSTYLQWRAAAENGARARRARDVGLEEIFGEMSLMTSLEASDVRLLLETERAVELALAKARHGASDLLECALATGKKVVLMSDMYLPAADVQQMLFENGLTGWDELHVSSETGSRKDSGEAYSRLIDREHIRPDQVLVVGDNERSDYQIPSDAGMSSVHVLRAVELARGWPRFGGLLEKAERHRNLHHSLGLGLIVRRFFGPLLERGSSHSSLVPRADAWSMGYAIAGPMVLSFSQWLLDRARNDGVDHLFFLAREGQFLKQIFDLLYADRRDVPETHYLVVSRRSVNVPAITSLADARQIAMSYFGPAPLEAFLEERYGVRLSDRRVDELSAKRIWEKGRLVKVRDRSIEHLEPLLEAIWPDVQVNVSDELPGMLTYLESMGVLAAKKPAVVDIGYSGTIQKCLNRLLGGGINGYYMATERSAELLGDDWQVFAQGCFHHLAEAPPNGPVFLNNSFTAEKLLSADEAQVVRYSLRSSGLPVAQFRELTSSELSCMSMRHQVRAGALAFVSEAMEVMNSVPDFRFPTDLAVDLYSRFVLESGADEHDLVADLVLEDHYCGRGLVS